MVLAAGAVYSAFLGDVIRFLPDERDYLILSRNLAEFQDYSLDGITPTAYRPPAYPYFLAVFVRIGVSIPGLRVVNYLVLVLTMFVLARLLQYRITAYTRPGTQSQFRSPSRLSSASWVAVMLVLGYPALFFSAGAFYPQTLAGLLFISILFLVNRGLPPENRSSDNDGKDQAFDKPALLDTTLAGILAGGLVLAVPTFLVIIIILFFWQVFASGFKTRVILSAVASFVLMGAVIGAWTARNILTLGDFVLVSTNVGDNLIRGNAPGATANSGPGTDVTQYMEQVSDLNEVDRDRALQKMVFHMWWSDPRRAVQLYFAKVLNYFNYRNDLVTKGESSQFRDMLMGASYYLILALAVGRLISGRVYPLNKLESLAAGLYLFNAFYSAVVFTRIRYRLPFDLLLIILAANFVGFLAGHSGKFQLRKLLIRSHS